MNLDELQSIRDRERQSDSLQQLRETFYADAGEFVQNLREERETAAERADDPFDAPEVNRLTDDIKTAEQTVEAIYERRVGKLVKMASFAAADMPTEDEGLTAEERELFEQLVASIEANREQVFGVLDGDDSGSETDASPADSTPAPESAEPAHPDPTDGVDAADLMGGSASPADEGSQPEPPVSDADEQRTPSPDGSGAGTASDDSGIDRPAPEAGTDQPTPESEAVTDSTATGATGNDVQSVPPDDPPGQVGGSGAMADDGPADTSSADSADTQQRKTAGGGVAAEPETRSDGGGRGAVERTTVRITRDVGEILGVDEREYDLSTEDVVTLPATNADPLVERDAAERLETQESG